MNTDQLVLEYEIYADQCKMNLLYGPIFEDGGDDGIIGMIGKAVTNIINLIKKAFETIVNIITNKEAKDVVERLKSTKNLASSDIVVDVRMYPYDDLTILADNCKNKIKAARTEEEVNAVMDEYRAKKEDIIKKHTIMKKVKIGAAIAAAIGIIGLAAYDKKVKGDIADTEKLRDAEIAKLVKRQQNAQKKADKAKAEIKKNSGARLAYLKLTSIFGLNKDEYNRSVQKIKESTENLKKYESTVKKAGESIDKKSKGYNEQIDSLHKKTVVSRATSALNKGEELTDKVSSVLEDPKGLVRDTINEREKRKKEERKAKEAAKKEKK